MGSSHVFSPDPSLLGSPTDSAVGSVDSQLRKSDSVDVQPRKVAKLESDSVGPPLSKSDSVDALQVDWS